jgi:hypothetical protein
MKRRCKLVALSVVALRASLVLAQVEPAGPNSSVKEPWAFTFTSDGYIVPHQDGYVSPILAADRGWLHLEARYNYENLRTGSFWISYNFSAGKELVLNLTPMIGGLFGRTTSFAPGCEAALTYRKVRLSVSNEFVFDTGNRSASFYFAWPEPTYSLLSWVRVGLVAQRTKAYHSSLDTQRGFLVGLSHKKIDFTTYVFNAGWTQPTVILEVGVSF